MSKRMTDTGKWDKAWYQNAPMEYKLFWNYILDRCDIAGIWDVNLKAASFFVGKKITKEGVFKHINGQIYEINDKYWLVVDFIKFQNTLELNLKSPVHKKILELLNSKGIDIKDNTLYDRVRDRVINTLIVIVNSNSNSNEVVIPNAIPNENQEKAKQKDPPIQKSDFSEEMNNRDHPDYWLYKIGTMVLTSCPDLMTLRDKLTFKQLVILIKDFGGMAVYDVFLELENKGIEYFKKKNYHSAYLTARSWIKNKEKWQR